MQFASRCKKINDNLQSIHFITSQLSLYLLYYAEVGYEFDKFTGASPRHCAN